VPVAWVNSKQLPVVEPVPPRETAGKVRDQLGELFGVSGRSSDFARKVVKNGTPELIQAVGV
jgi:hypothetical protein